MDINILHLQKCPEGHELALDTLRGEETNFHLFWCVVCKKYFFGVEGGPDFDGVVICGNPFALPPFLFRIGGNKGAKDEKRPTGTR